MGWERYIFFIGLIIFTAPYFALAQDIEYSQEIEYLNERYRDYFIHENMKNRMNEQRRQGADEQREYRKNLEIQKEKARKNFVKNRRQNTKSVNWEELEEKYEVKKQQQEQKKNRERKRFAKKRQKLMKIKKQAKSIPEEKLVGLE
ncbi:MAG: hypothetical protein KDD58_00950 [Bdellovibrionales bacterium]|nr:hypothetical protein [Bdellovibrionales bacterium]